MKFKTDQVVPDNNLPRHKLYAFINPMLLPSVDSITFNRIGTWRNQTHVFSDLKMTGQSTVDNEVDSLPENELTDNLFWIPSRISVRKKLACKAIHTGKRSPPKMRTFDVQPDTHNFFSFVRFRKQFFTATLWRGRQICLPVGKCPPWTETSRAETNALLGAIK